MAETEPKETQKAQDEKLLKKLVYDYDNHPLQGQGLKQRAGWNAMYEGNQWQAEAQDQSEEGYMDDGQEHQSKINQLKTSGHVVVSNLVREQPKVSARPTGLDNDDALAARAAGHLLSYQFDRHELNLIVKEYEALENAFISGTGWWKVMWDPDAYAKLPGKFGNNGKVGDIKVTVHDDFEIFPDPSATDYIDMRFVFEAYMADITDLKERFKDKIKVEDIVSATHDEISEARFRYALEEHQKSSERVKGKAFVIEYWERPTEKHKKGRKVTIINKVHIIVEDNPMAKYGRDYSLPYIPFFFNKRSYRFHGYTPLVDMIPIQVERNMCASLIMENIRDNSSTQTWVPEGGSTKLEEVDGHPGMHFFNPTYGPPTTTHGESFPHYVLEWDGTLAAYNDDIAGSHDVSRGSTPPGAGGLPASGIKLLMDSEAIMNAPNMRRLKNTLLWASGLMMRIMAEEYEEPRLIDILGKDNSYEAKAISKADLNGSFDITLEVTSAISTSMATKLEVAAMAWDRGVPQEAEEGSEAAIKYMEIMEFGQVERFREVKKLYQERAYWVLEQIEKHGKMPDLYAVDDPKTILDVLTKFILSASFQEEDKAFKDAVLDAAEKMQENLEAKNAQLAQNAGARSGEQASPPDQQAQMMAMGDGGQPPMVPPGQTGEIPPMQMPPPGGGVPMGGEMMMPPVAPMPGQGVV